MARQYVIKAKVGEYKDANGNLKTKYLEIGAVFDGQNGLVLKLDAVPTGWDGFAFLQVPEQRQGNRQQGGGQRQNSNYGRNGGGGNYGRPDDNMDDDVPF